MIANAKEFRSFFLQLDSDQAARWLLSAISSWVACEDFLEKLKGIHPLEISPDDRLSNQLWLLSLQLGPPFSVTFGFSVSDALKLWNSTDGLATMSELADLAGRLNRTELNSFVSVLPHTTAFEIGSTADRREALARCAEAVGRHSGFRLDGELFATISRLRTRCSGDWQASNAVGLVEALVRREPLQIFAALYAFREDIAAYTIEQAGVVNDLLHRVVRMVGVEDLAQVFMHATGNDVWVLSYLFEQPPDRRLEPAPAYSWRPPLSVRPLNEDFIKVTCQSEHDFREFFLERKPTISQPAVDWLIKRVAATGQGRPALHLVIDRGAELLRQRVPR